MGGFVDPFIPSPAWPQDIVFTGSSWTGSASSLADSSAGDVEFHLRNGSSPTLMYGGRAKEAVDGAVFPGETVLSPVKLHEQLLQAELQQSDGLNFAMDGAAECALMDGTLGSILSTPCPMSLTDSAPGNCSSNESSGSEQSGLPQFLMGDQQPVSGSAPWPSAYANVSSMVGEETPQSFGFGRIHNDDLLHEATCTPNGKKYQQLGTVPSVAQLQLHDDVEFRTGKLVSFAPGQQVTPSIDSLQINQEFSGLQHLNLSSLVSGPLASFNATGAAHNPKQCTEASSGKNGMIAPFVNRSEVPNGNGSAGNGAPKPRVRARRGQATDPHSIAERLRREKISDRMKNLQELVPNSNKTDKASMLDEIIEYVKFLQLQVKVLSMSRLGATEAVVPLLTESQTESSGLLLSPRSGERQAGPAAEGGVLAQSELQDSSAFEQEVVQLMENNMTTAMQYLQSKGLCLMPVALASAISSQKGTSSTAIRQVSGGTDNGVGGGDTDDVKRVLDALKPLRNSPKEMKSRT